MLHAMLKLLHSGLQALRSHVRYILFYYVAGITLGLAGAQGPCSLQYNVPIQASPRTAPTRPRRWTTRWPGS